MYFKVALQFFLPLLGLKSVINCFYPSVLILSKSKEKLWSVAHLPLQQHLHSATPVSHIVVVICHLGADLGTGGGGHLPLCHSGVELW